jgi:hypothetical protein
LIFKSQKNDRTQYEPVIISFSQHGSRANFAKHAANLWGIKQMIQKNLAKKMGAFCDTIPMADGLPIPVCKFARANFRRIFEGDAA